MATMNLYDPFQDMLSLRDAVNQLFMQSFVRPGWGGSGSGSQGYGFPINVAANEQSYLVYALLPGLKPEDIEVTLQENSLTIKGQFHPFTQQSEGVKWLLNEFGPSAFERTITFPKMVDGDHIETRYENGVLQLLIPISEASRVKRITIGSGQTQKELAGAH